MTIETNTPVSHLSFSAIEAAVHARVAPLRRFATGVDVARTPAGIVAPFTRSAWKALTPSARVDHITAGIKAQVQNAPPYGSRAAGTVANGPRVAVKAARSVEAAVAVEVFEPAAPVEAAVDVEIVEPAASALVALTASSWLVPCAGGCGALVPARSARPVVAFCSPHPAQRRSARMKLNDNGVLVMIRARAKAVCAVTGPKLRK